MKKKLLRGSRKQSVRKVKVTLDITQAHAAKRKVGEIIITFIFLKDYFMTITMKE